MQPKIIIFLCLLLSFPQSWAKTGDINYYTLKNGLKLITKEDHRSPIIVLQLWYKVGSSYEPLGITGISHVLEHMMFQGTKRYGPGEFQKLIVSNGGLLNAETYFDYTVYHELFAKEKLPLILTLEAERMYGLQLKPQNFNSEKQVVLEELKLRLEDVPEEKATTALFATAFLSNPYHTPVIGWPHDIQNLSLNNLGEWYAKWYAPNNAILVIVGDVAPNDVYNLVKKYFGNLLPKVIPSLKPQQEIFPSGERSVIVKTSVNLPHIFIGFNVPSLKSADNNSEVYALEVLNYLLSGDANARFAKQLVRRTQLAVTASSFYDIYSRLDGLFILEGIPTSSHSVNDLKMGMLKIIDDLKTKLVSVDELGKIKTQILANKIYAEDAIDVQGRELGVLEVIGLPYKEYFAYNENIQQITSQQIRDVVRKYFVANRTSIAILQSNKSETNHAKTF
jgi:zinc protease